MLWEASITGTATLPTGAKLALSPADWFGVVKFIYAQVDGPPRAEVDVTSGGTPIAVMIYLPDNERDKAIEDAATDTPAEGAAGTLPGDPG
jgi:hypothetical protein